MRRGTVTMVTSHTQRAWWGCRTRSGGPGWCWLVGFLLMAIRDGVGAQHVHAGQNRSGGSLSDVMFRTVWRGYEASVRPLCRAYPATTTVHMGIALRQLQQLDEPKQILSTNLWLRVTWFECRLVWNATWWNVSRLIVPYSAIWTPDLTLYDNAESGLSGVPEYRLVVTSEGAVSQQVPVVVHSLCQLDVSRFPFDTQACNLTFGSWVYHGLELNLTSSKDPVDLTSYVTHGEWEVLSLRAVRIEPYFMGLPYPQVIFTLVLKRRHLFYIISMLFPCALIQLMAALAFLLPCETNEKVGLEITVLLSLAVMQLVIMDMIPASSETLPIIGLYFTLAMIVVSASCMMTVVVLAVHYPHRHHPLPPWALAVLRSKLALCFGIDIKAEQKNLKLHDVRADPYVTQSASSNHRKSATNVNGHASGSLDTNRRPLSKSHGDCAPRKTNSDVTNAYDVSLDDSFIGYSYSVEGARGKRFTYRPGSADVSLTTSSGAAEDRPPDGPHGNVGGTQGRLGPRQWQETAGEWRGGGAVWEMVERGEERQDNGRHSRGGRCSGMLEQPLTAGRRENPEQPPTESWEMWEQPRRNSQEMWKPARRDSQGTVEQAGRTSPEISEQRHGESQEMLVQARRKSQETPEHAHQEDETPNTADRLRTLSRQMLEPPGKESSRGKPKENHGKRRSTAEEAEEGESWRENAVAVRQPPELWAVVEICGKILDCMKEDRKKPAAGDPAGEKLDKKVARRQWEMMARLLDRVFLLVFMLLTVIMFSYVYITIV